MVSYVRMSVIVFGQGVGVHRGCKLRAKEQICFDDVRSESAD